MMLVIISWSSSDCSVMVPGLMVFLFMEIWISWLVLIWRMVRWRFGVF